MNLIITIISIYKICTSSGRPGGYPEEDLINKKKINKDIMGCIHLDTAVGPS